LTAILEHDHEQRSDPPSEWVARWVPGIAPNGDVLDLACGMGRHSRFLAARGFRVCAVDRDRQSLESLRGISGITVVHADLENAPWPFAARKFDGVVVTNYLHRPILPRILEALAPAGVLIYETFAVGNERFGKPSNPNFLLRPGELLELVQDRLRVMAYEDLEVATPKAARVQRICASGVMRDAPASKGIG